MASSKRIRRRIRLFLLIFWSIALAWFFYSMQARGFDPAVLESDPSVQVQVTDQFISFRHVTDTTAVGLIFYPGALVDPEAYAPLAREVAASGYRVVIVKVPFRMDVFEGQWDEVVRRTEAVLAEDAGPRAWVVGGHSRGGKMAARLAGKHPDRFGGLLLVGTSHPRRDDLSHLAIDVTKVYGSQDGLASVQEVEAFSSNLPANTHFIRIEGGNHRQFGYYGWQPGDGAATIDRETQRNETAEAVLEQLRRVEREGRRIPACGSQALECGT